MQSQRRRKATSVRRVLRAARSNLGGTDRIKADFRTLGEHLWQFSLPIALFLPHGSSVCRHRAPCKPSSVIGTSVSLRRIDRAYYQDRCDVHSDTSDDTYSLTRRGAAKRSRQEPHKATRTASSSSDRRARSMSESQGQARRAATQSGATSRASACAGAPQPTV